MDAGSFLDELLYSAQAEQVPICGNDVRLSLRTSEVGPNAPHIVSPPLVGD